MNGSTWYQFISDVPLGLSSGIEGKKESTIGFTLECQFRVHSSQRKRGDGSFNMNLEKNQKFEFKWNQSTQTKKEGN